MPPRRLELGGFVVDVGLGRLFGRLRRGAQALDLLDQEENGPAGRSELGVGFVLCEPLSPAAKLGNLSCIHEQSMTRDQSENDSCAVRMRSSNAKSMLGAPTTSATGPVRRGVTTRVWRMATVQLFATCLGDLTLEDAVADAETLLREAGFEVVFPEAQVCCGQPAFNSGHRAAARRVARTFAKAFSREAPVVVPSGSCATMAAHYLPELLGVEPFEVWELSAFLDRAGFQPPVRNEGCRISYHDSCHMLRELRISDPPRRLLESSGAELVPLERADLCCGFGGTFSVRQPEVSVAMADDKLGDAATAGTLVTADPGCLVHLRGRAERVGSDVRVVHLATALARGVDA